MNLEMLVGGQSVSFDVFSREDPEWRYHFILTKITLLCVSYKVYQTNDSKSIIIVSEIDCVNF